MRNNVVTIVTSAALVASQLAVPAMPQSTYPYPPPGGPQIQPARPGNGYAGTLRCESRNNKTQRCNVRTDNRVDLLRVIGGRCSKGRDWGFAANQIWVSGGCRAEFGYGYASGGGYPQPRCRNLSMTMRARCAANRRATVMSNAMSRPATASICCASSAANAMPGGSGVTPMTMSG